MLKGKEFGAAISAAIQLKLDTGAVRSKAEIARHFGIKPPSLHDWEKKGSVDKAKLPELWRFFSDVVGPEHWGLSRAEWPTGLPASGVDQKPAPAKAWPYTDIDEAKFRSLDGRQAAQLEGAILLAAAQLGVDIKK